MKAGIPAQPQPPIRPPVCPVRRAPPARPVPRAHSASLDPPAPRRRTEQRRAAFASPSFGPALDRLTPRQREVLRLIARGCTSIGFVSQFGRLVYSLSVYIGLLVSGVRDEDGEGWAGGGRGAGRRPARR